MRNRLLARLAFGLLLTELLLVLVSWLLSAMPTVEVRSLLTGEGVRWLIGRMCDCIASPMLAWILFAGMGWGCLRRCGLLSRTSASSRHDRPALISMLVLLVLYVCALLLLTAVPHALLLSATGSLFPSPFSIGFIPLVVLGATLAAMAYGIASGCFSSLTDIYESLLSGIRSFAPIVLFYILIAQIYYTVRFVFL